MNLYYKKRVQRMQIEQCFERQKMIKKIRLKVNTNRNVNFITAIRPEALISQLANRALSIFLQLTEGDSSNAATRKQLTVSAVKQGIFYMPKSQYVYNLLAQDDEVQVVIVKAKPKYPHQIYQHQITYTNHIPIQQKSRKTQCQPIAYPITSLNVSCKHSIQIIDGQILQDRQDQIVDLELESKASNKQKNKRDKKKRKIQMKRKIFEEAHKMRKGLQQQNLKQDKYRLIEGIPKKKIKLDKQQKIKSPQNFFQLSIPSPKITFHNQPKTQSPKINVMNESGKKRFVLEAKQYKGYVDVDQKYNVDKMVSPLNVAKSYTAPFMAMTESIHSKDKKQVNNFILPRKYSQDKKNEMRKQKYQKQINNLHNDETQLLKAQQISQLLIEAKSVNNNYSVKPLSQQNIALKSTSKIITVVEAEDSDSEQNKKISSSIVINHRQKQLLQINKKIIGFVIQSDQD